MNIININKQTTYSSSNRTKIPLALIVFTLSIITLSGFNNSVFATGVPYSITYDDNVVSNMPVDANDKTLNSTVSISSSTPTLSGKKFLGWCNSVPTTTDGIDSCSGTAYQPSSNLSIDQTGTGNNFHLYAMWGESTTFNKAYAAAGKTQSGGYYTMQDANASICSAVDEGEVGEVKDSRDGTIYHIGKLKDGKCWMVENLNLAGGTALSADNTDVTSEYIASYTAGDSRLAKSGNTLVLPASDTAGFNTANYSYVYNSDNTTNCGAYGQKTPCYSYYSWDAATLGSGRTIDTENTDAPYSICPKGWRLPTSGSDSNNEWKRGDFYKLATAYGASLESSAADSFSDTSANFYNNAGPGTVPNFLLAGYYWNGSFSAAGSNSGSYWSSTSYSMNSYARYFDFGSSGVTSAGNLSRRSGFSIRCLFGD